jgi:hypothetical protein
MFFDITVASATGEGSGQTNANCMFATGNSGKFWNATVIARLGHNAFRRDSCYYYARTGYDARGPPSHDF